MASDDRILLTGLRVTGYHGVLESERLAGQPFVIDLGIRIDARAAARSDAITDTVHYGELAEQVAAVVAGEPVNLIETLAERIAEVVLQQPLTTEVEVTVHKPEAPIPLQFADVAVTIRRGRGS